MTTGEKISKLRREHNYTQEQLAELLGVSRQSISKYESGTSYPETAKLIKLSELFDCTVDYLLKDDIDMHDSQKQSNTYSLPIFQKFLSFEKKSKRTLFGLPLWHISKNAKGIFAFGFKAQGIFSFGLLSIGLFSFGILSLGLLALGVFSLGILSAGCISIGALTCGAIALGVLSIGAIAIGEFSIGALSIGHYFACGDYASAMFAFGDTHTNGSVFEYLGKLSLSDKQQVINEMYQKIPEIYHWLVDLTSSII